MTGNFDPEDFIFVDIDTAVVATHDLPEPTPARMSPKLMAEVVNGIIEANPDKADEYEHFGSAVAWGIAIGVLAERNRLMRIKR